MQFPYGLANFQEISTEGYFYVDRTDRIAQIERTGKQLLLLRPRRFGKSLWLSTLENYYDLAREDQFESMFGQLSIGQNPTPERNSYLVLKLNFSVVDPIGDHKHIRKSFFGHINQRIRAFGNTYAEYLKHPISIDPEDGIVSFQALLDAVQFSGQKLYLLIDEYDNFANEVMVSHTHGTDRYQELVAGEGIIKTFFKAVKEGTEGRGLRGLFITGVSPVVMSDITSGFNIVEDISNYSCFNDLCGFSDFELKKALNMVIQECSLSEEQQKEVLELMHTFYNGYCFSTNSKEVIYNPTLILYFLKGYLHQCTYPENLLDSNLSMDRNRIQYVADLPYGESLVTQAIASEEENTASNLVIDRLADRFGVEEMLNNPKDHTFLASLLYYFGVLTLAGRQEQGQLCLKIPNLVVRKLYIERMQEAILPDYEGQEQRQQAAKAFYTQGDLKPLCDFLEKKYLKVFDNRDLCWSNELTVKTAFLTMLFNDTFYIMDSERAIKGSYTDLTMILRPDTRNMP